MKLLLLFSYLLLAISNSTNDQAVKIAVISVCLRSHLRIILSVAKELSMRSGVSMTFTIPKECEDYVLSIGLNMTVISIPTPVDNTPVPTGMHDVSRYLISIEKEILDYYIESWETPENRPDIILSGSLVLAATDLAEKFDLKQVVLCPNVIAYHAMAGTSSFMKEYNSLSTPYDVYPASDYSLIRTLRHFVKNCIYSIIVHFGVGLRNSLRNRYGLGNAENLNGYGVDRPYMTMIEGYFDFVEPSLVPPYVEIVGPLMLNLTNMPNQQDTIEWVQATDKFIYVAFGTMLELTENQGEILDKLIESSPYKFLVVSKTFKSDLNNVKVVSFTNQLDILQSSKVLVFITHGGQGGIMEATHSLVPILCLPQVRDQFYTCERVQATGIGKMIKPSELTLERLSGDLEEVLSNSVYKYAVQRANLIMSTYAGPKRAADLVLLFAEVGYDHLLTSWYNLPWYKKNDLDIFFIYGLVIYLLLKTLKYLWSRINNRR